jgi:hypothetical protein
LLGEHRGDVHELTLYDIVIPNLFNSSWEWLTSIAIYTIGLFVFYVGFLDFQESILCVKTRVLGKGSWDNEESICKASDTKLGLT